MLKKVLVVDDEQDILEVVKGRLESASFEVLTASSGKDGLLKAQSEKPDLILMDIMMPDMSGGDVVRILKNDPETKKIPVVFLSAVVSKVDEKDGAAGINVENERYPAIAKPFDPVELINVVTSRIHTDNF